MKGIVGVCGTCLDLVHWFTLADFANSFWLELERGQIK